MAKLPYDPVLRLLKGSLCRTLARAVLWSVGINGALLYGSGLTLSLWHDGERSFVRAFDFPEIYVAFLVHWFFLPVAWVLFVWQPDSVSALVDSLRNNGVIGIPDRTKRISQDSVDSYSAKLTTWFSHPSLVCVATGMSLSLSGAFVLLFSGESAIWTMPEQYWWRVNPWYFGVWLLLVVCLGYYMVTMIALRVCVTTLWLHGLFRAFGARVHPLHDDGCGGVACVGGFAVQLFLMAVLAGMWVATLSANSLVVLGKAGTSAFYSLLPLYPLYVAYVGILLLSLILPVWSAHVAMKAEKRRQVALVGKKLREAMTAFDGLSGSPKEAAAIGQKVFILRHIYEVTEWAYPEWPLKLALAQKAALAIVAIVPPVISTAVTTASAFGLVSGK